MKNYLFAVCSGVLIWSGCSSVDMECRGSKTYSPPSPSIPAERAAESVDGFSGMITNRVSAKSHAAAGRGEESSFFKKSERMMAYSAGFTLIAKERKKALAEVKALAEKMGGYMVSSARGSIRVKIPVEKADAFMNTAGAYGKLEDFRISAEDLTDTITDLDVRLDNLRKLRTRLTELLGKARTVEEMLKVERELNRVTTEIERIDAQLQNNKNRVAMVTFDIYVIEQEGAMPGGVPPAIGQFNFLNNFIEPVAGDEEEPLCGIDVPADFIMLADGNDDSGFAAVSSDDCFFKTWQVGIPSGSSLEFWNTMVCRALDKTCGCSEIKTLNVDLNGRKAVKISAVQVTRTGIQRYMAVISIKECWFGNDELQIVEFFGPENAFEKHEKAVTAAVLK